jgi:hypothetical protein
LHVDALKIMSPLLLLNEQYDSLEHLCVVFFEERALSCLIESLGALGYETVYDVTTMKDNEIKYPEYRRTPDYKGNVVTQPVPQKSRTKLLQALL